MNNLINYAREQGLDAVTEYALQSEQTHGVAVSYSPFWLYCWKMAQTHDARFLDRFWKSFYEMNPFVRSRLNDYFNEVNSEYVDVSFDTITSPIDVSWRPPFWQDLGFGSILSFKYLGIQVPVN